MIGMPVQTGGNGSYPTGYTQPVLFSRPAGAGGMMTGMSGFVDAFGNATAQADPYAGAFASPFGGGAGQAQQALFLSPGSPQDEIRTIFISGFPPDVKERELNNMLRFLPGYEASQMNWKTGTPQGFALFNTALAARTVVDLLSGLQFDDGVVLRAEMAHKNMFLKV